jgi:hypothetical protein
MLTVEDEWLVALTCRPLFTSNGIKLERIWLKVVENELMFKFEIGWGNQGKVEYHQMRRMKSDIWIFEAPRWYPLPVSIEDRS